MDESMITGLLDWPWWALVLYTLVTTHISIIGITIYLHRQQAHRALDLSPFVGHLLRFWLWLSTATVTREWVAVHRKHHAKVETEDDPHSPVVLGIWKVLLEGRELYHRAAHDIDTLKRYGHGTPEDWIERHLYSRHSYLGIYLLLALQLLLFGPIAITIWAVQLLWQPVFAAGIINGAGHFWGYRNFETADASTNIVPWGVLIGGEELHNNHHAFASSAKLSSKPWEFDLGWIYIRALERMGLARVKKLPPSFVLRPEKSLPDVDTVKAVISNRMQVMARYARVVLRQVYRDELARCAAGERPLLKGVHKLLVREESLLNADARARLDEALSRRQALKVVYLFRQRLQSIWKERSANYERLRDALEEWCTQAEASGIRALQDFARTLPNYSTQGA